MNFVLFFYSSKKLFILNLSIIVWCSQLTCSVVAGLYTTGACVASGVRSTDDSLNYGFGGSLAGAFIGLQSKSVHKVILNAIVFFMVGGATDYIAKKIPHPTKEIRDKKIAEYNAHHNKSA